MSEQPLLSGVRDRGEMQVHEDDDMSMFSNIIHAEVLNERILGSWFPYWADKVYLRDYLNGVYGAIPTCNIRDVVKNILKVKEE